jgi:hypothetical protein
MIDMKRVLLALTAVLSTFVITGEAAASRDEVYQHCAHNNPPPSNFLWKNQYLVRWHSGTPVIFYSRWHGESEPLLLAEYNREDARWVYYGYVPNRLVKSIEKRWETKQRAFKDCLLRHSHSYSYAYNYEMEQQHHTHAYGHIAPLPEQRQHKKPLSRVIIVKPRSHGKVVVVKPQARRKVVVRHGGEKRKKHKKHKKRRK